MDDELRDNVTPLENRKNNEKSIGLEQVLTETSLKNFHQNIRGLRNKSNELYCRLSYNLPHVICISEYHLKDYELQLIHLNDYTLGANYCRKFFHKGGVSIFVYNKLKYNTINLEEFTVETDIEACAISLPINSLREKKLCILTIYRSPSGNFINFLKRLDMILQKLYRENYNIIMRGDIKVNYLNEDNRKNQLDAVMHSYNLNSIVTFPTRADSSTSTLIDDFFIDITRNGEYDIYPFMNGLSDHDAQVLILRTVQKLGQQHYIYMKQMINSDTIAHFQTQLSYEL